MAKKSNTNMVVGVGLAAIAALAAGGYFLYGKDGAKNRKKIRSWMLKAKGEVLEGVEKMKNVSEAEYNMVVDKVASKYQAFKNVDPKEFADMVRELRGHWKNIKKSITVTPKKKTAKRV
jgi:hypothetical protein